MINTIVCSSIHSDIESNIDSNSNINENPEEDDFNYPIENNNCKIFYYLCTITLVGTTIFLLISSSK
jgi:hypothetical protein